MEGRWGSEPAPRWAWSSPPRAIRMRRMPGGSSRGAEPSTAADDGELLCFHAGTAPARRPVRDGRRPRPCLGRPRRNDEGGARCRLPGRGERRPRWRALPERHRLARASRRRWGSARATRPGERGTCLASSSASSVARALEHVQAAECLLRPRGTARRSRSGRHRPRIGASWSPPAPATPRRHDRRLARAASREATWSATMAARSVRPGRRLGAGSP